MFYNDSDFTLTLERKDCQTCLYGAGGQGEYTRTVDCATCKGTGRGPRGGARGCRTCFGSGNGHDFENPIVCPSCKGDFKDAALESFCDYAPQTAIDALLPTLRVVRTDRANTFNESYLGIGSLYSVVDYGDAWKNPDSVTLAKVIEHLREDRTQAVKIVRPYERGDQVATLHNELVIVITRDGYHIKAVSA